MKLPYAELNENIENKPFQRIASIPSNNLIFSNENLYTKAFQMRCLPFCNLLLKILRGAQLRTPSTPPPKYMPGGGVTAGFFTK
jgi:hypothetical protein